MKEVEQNYNGLKIAYVYFDDGKFKLRYFDREDPNMEQLRRNVLCRNESEIERTEVDLNFRLGLDDWSMPIEGFPEPFANCCFVSDDNLYVCVFYTYTQTHHHLIWDT